MPGVPAARPRSTRSCGRSRGTGTSLAARSAARGGRCRADRRRPRAATTRPCRLTCEPQFARSMTVSETRGSARRCARRRRPSSMFTSTRPSSQSYHVATVTGEPSGRTVAMTAAFGFARKASSSGGRGGGARRRAYHPSAIRSATRCQATRPPTHRCSPGRRRTCRRATPGASRSSGTASARSRACTATTCELLVAQRQAPRREARRRRRGAAARADAAPTACSTASCARSTRTASRASSSSSAARARSPTSSSTCSSSTASRSSREPWSRRRELLEELIRPGAPLGRALAGLRRRRGAARGRTRARARGRHGQARRARPTGPAAAATTGARSSSARRPTLRIAGYTAGAGLAQQPRRADPRDRRARVRGQLRQRPLGRRTCASCSRRSRRCGARRSPLRGAGPTGARPARASPGSSRRSRCEVEFTEWTREHRLRAPVFKRLAKEGPVRQAGSASSSSRTRTRSSSPTRRSRRATCSPTTARSRRCSCRTCATGRSRSCATPTASRASTSSRSSAPPHAPALDAHGDAPEQLRRHAARRSTTS